MINYTLLLLRQPLRLFRLFHKFLSFVYHFLLLKINRVEYAAMPIVRGTLILKNSGDLILGKNIKFNCSVRSNLVGLNKTCTISVRHGARLIIGDNSGFSGVSIYCSDSIILGKYVNLGGNVSVWDTDFHPLSYLDRRTHVVDKIKSAPIVIGDDVFIGANAIILKGVTIGNRAIVGAGSVVTKDIPAAEIWAGNPAKFIKCTSEEKGFLNSSKEQIS